MDIKSEEIFSVGTWNGETFTESDLDGIVSSFSALGLSGKVPNKFGHTKAKDMPVGMPAIGWVSRIWREGKKLMADFTDVPLVVYEAIKKKLYKFVSVELLRDVKAGTRTIPWVLDAVALLGADPPAVGDLKALQALTMSRSSGLQGRERVTFRRDDNSGGRKMADVSEEEVNRRLAAQKAEFDRKEAETNTRFAALEKERLKDKAEARRSAIKMKFDRKVEDKKLLPRSLEGFTKRYMDTDENVLKITDAEVDTFMAEREEVDAPQIKANNKGGAKDNKDKDAEVESGTNADVLMSRVDKTIVARGQKVGDVEAIEAATKIEFRKDPALAKAYLKDPNATYTPKKEDEAA